MLTINEKLYNTIIENLDDNGADAYIDMVNLLKKWDENNRDDDKLENAIAAAVESLTGEKITDNRKTIFENLFYNFC